MIYACRTPALLSDIPVLLPLNKARAIPLNVLFDKKNQPAVLAGRSYSGWSVVSGQWSVVSGQWSVVSGQWSLVTGQWSAVSDQWSVVSGQWSVVSGQRLVISDQ